MAEFIFILRKADVTKVGMLQTFQRNINILNAATTSAKCINKRGSTHLHIALSVISQHIE